MVLIVGWGIENGDKFYLVQEDLGSRWGDKGYVKIFSGVKGIHSLRHWSDGALNIQL